MKLSLRSILTTQLFTKILLLLVPTIFAFCYVLKLKKDLKSQYSKIAYSTIGVMTNLYNEIKTVENDKTIDQTTCQEVNSINNSVLSLILSIGADSIAEAFDELSDKEKEVVAWARHNISIEVK